MVGIEALLGAGQRLDPRLSHKAVAEAARLMTRLMDTALAKNMEESAGHQFRRISSEKVQIGKTWDP